VGQNIKIGHLSSIKTVHPACIGEGSVLDSNVEGEIMLTYQGWLLRPAVYVVLGFLLAILAASAVGLATQNTIAGLMVGIGVLVLVGLVLVWVARDRGLYREASETNYMGVGIAIGMGFGVPYGIVLSAAVDNFAFLGVGAAVGVGMGVAVGTGLNERHKLP
jgi:hypothetical protein